jgi:3',5'-cyclic AMP phosphodiesterase CpdA
MHERMTRIVHLSDIQFGVADRTALAAAKTAVRALAPDCTVVTGDITLAGRKQEFSEAAAWFADWPSPVAACPGNDDAPAFALMQRMTRPFRRHAALGLLTRWAASDQSAAVASFNSARAAQLRTDWSQGAYSLKQVQAAVDAVSAAAPQGWRMIACHHPPVTPSGGPLLARTRRGAAAVHLVRNQAKLVQLAGHVQAFTVNRRGEAIFITAPSLASLRARGRAKGEAVWGFVVLDLKADAATATLWRYLDGAFVAAECESLSTQAGPLSRKG